MYNWNIYPLTLPNHSLILSKDKKSLSSYLDFWAKSIKHAKLERCLPRPALQQRYNHVVISPFLSRGEIHHWKTSRGALVRAWNRNGSKKFVVQEANNTTPIEQNNEININIHIDKNYKESEKQFTKL